LFANKNTTTRQPAIMVEESSIGGNSPGAGGNSPGAGGEKNGFGGGLVCEQRTKPKFAYSRDHPDDYGHQVLGITVGDYRDAFIPDAHAPVATVLLSRDAPGAENGGCCGGGGGNNTNKRWKKQRMPLDLARPNDPCATLSICKTQEAPLAVRPKPKYADNVTRRNQFIVMDAEAFGSFLFHLPDFVEKVLPWVGERAAMLGHGALQQQEQGSAYSTFSVSTHVKASRALAKYEDCNATLEMLAIKCEASVGLELHYLVGGKVQMPVYLNQMLCQSLLEELPNLKEAVKRARQAEVTRWTPIIDDDDNGGGLRQEDDEGKVVAAAAAAVDQGGRRGGGSNDGGGEYGDEADEVQLIKRRIAQNAGEDGGSVDGGAAAAAPGVAAGH